LGRSCQAHHYYFMFVWFVNLVLLCDFALLSVTQGCFVLFFVILCCSV